MKHAIPLLILCHVINAVVAGHARADNYTPTGSVVKVANGTTAQNYTHTEGPMYDGNGGILFGELNSSHTNGLIYRYDINGATPNVTQVVSNSGGMQGASMLNATQVVTADRDSRTVDIRPLSNLNTITTAISAISGSAGVQLNGPNDLIVDSAGGVYFTDPNFENFSGGPGFDAVYYIAPGAATAKRVISFANDRPNGIALSPDGKTLYLGLWQDNLIYKFAVNTPGTPTNAATFAGVTSPDGMTIDPWGNLIVARSGGIICYSPAGKTLFDYTTNSQVTNVELGPAAGGGTALYFTTYNSPSMGLFRLSLIAPVPEPASVAVLGIAAASLLAPRPKKR